VRQALDLLRAESLEDGAVREASGAGLRELAEVMPHVDALGAEYGVSRNTVRQALGLLRAESLEDGAGTGGLRGGPARAGRSAATRARVGGPAGGGA